MSLFSFRKKSSSESNVSTALIIGGGKANATNGRKKAEGPSAFPNTPPSMQSKGEQEFSEIYGSSMVQSQRWFLFAMLSMVLAIAATVTVFSVMPLKEVKPWLVEYNSSTGVVSRPVEVQKVAPDKAVILAEMARWIEAIYTIDPLRSTDLLRWANTRAADKAVGQFADFRQRERIYERMRAEPTMTREVRIKTADGEQPGTAFFYITTTERTAGTTTVGKDQVKNYRVTLHYKQIDIKTQEEMFANPTGLMITYFSDAVERAL